MIVSSKEQAFQQGMLIYFNQRLLKRGVITEQEYRTINLKIHAHGGEKARRG